LFANLENLTLTGSTIIDGTGNDLNNILIGNSANNRLYGQAGNDQLSGGAGDDYLDGGLGLDVFIGGLGNDTFIVDNSSEQISENLNEGTDTVLSSTSLVLSANLENLTLTGSTTIDGTGNDLNNILVGNSANNRLYGQAGNDQLSGGAGDDYLDGGLGLDAFIGGLGNDTFVVDNSAEQISENLNEGTDTVLSSASFLLTANLENLTLTGVAILDGTGNDLNNILIGNSANNNLLGLNGDDSLSGGAGNDTLDGGLGNDSLFGEDGNDLLTGNAGNDILTGGFGDDKLIGGTGNDVLTGGAGKDLFSFNTSTEGVDTITDFSVIDDRFQIVAAGFKGGLVTGTLKASQFRLGSSANNSSQRFIYNTSNGALFFDVDGNGASAQIQIATLSGLPSLSASSFTII
jgi:Ca2+-binding RTX toxin-like protein